ncbi:MAG: endonuclease/exonuclease/phosphatase family protein [Pseudomonas sp.]
MRCTLLCLLAVAATACQRLESMSPANETCRRFAILDGDDGLPVNVAWSEVADSADRYALDYWCETVGPAVIDVTPAPRDAGSVPIDSIAIVSWNTHVGGGDVERLVHDLRAGRFTNGRPVRHFVLLLQEVHRAGDEVPARVRIDVPRRITHDPPGPTPRRDIVETARRLGLALFYVPSMRNGPPRHGLPNEDRGNAVLSTIELENVRAIELPYEVERRVIAVAAIEARTIAGARAEVVLASVHLDTRSRLLRLSASLGRGRVRQASALIAELADQEMVVVGGDFNTWGPELLEDALPRLRVAFAGTPEPPPFPTFQYRFIQRRLDYLFFRVPDEWRASYTRIDSRYGSDHHPLLGWLQSSPE